MNFKSNAKEVVHRANKAVYKTLGTFADNCVKTAKANAPVGETNKVQDSIGCRFSTGKAYIGSDWYIARLVETGHATRNGGHVSARPFLRPAVQSNVPAVRRTLKSNLESA